VSSLIQRVADRGANTAASTITLPGAPTSPNLLVLLWSSRGAADATIPAGFTSLDILTTLAGGRLGIAYRRVIAGDPAAWNTAAGPSRRYELSEWAGLADPASSAKGVYLANTYPTTPGGVTAPLAGDGKRIGQFGATTDIAGRETHVQDPPTTLLSEGPTEAAGNGPYQSVGWRDSSPLTATALNNQFQDVGYIVGLFAEAAGQGFFSDGLGGVF
jgi:hypothetical protein